MDEIRCKLTIYFENPFWVGVFEQICNEKLTAVKVVFGKEPKDIEVQKYIIKNYSRLQFSPEVPAVLKKEKKNPKRMLKEAKQQLQSNGIQTKSQQALKLLQEQSKQLHHKQKQENKKRNRERIFLLKQLKKKQKHKGH